MTQPRAAGSVMRATYAAMVLAIFGTLVFGLVPYHGQITRFFQIGDRYPAPPTLVAPFIHHGEDGYDGAQYLALALDPLISQPTTRAALDNPGYRSRRILEPAIVFAATGGNAAVAPFVIVGLNLAAFVLLLWFIGQLWTEDSEPLDILLVLGLTGVWISMLFSTPELVEAALLMGAMLAYRRDRPSGVGLCLALALLCRETSAVVFLAFVITGFVRRDRRLFIHLAWAWIPAAIWDATVWWRLGTSQALGSANFDWPVAGFITAFHSQSDPSVGRQNAIYWMVATAGLLAVTVVFLWRFRSIARTHLPLAFAGLGYAALLGFIGPAVLKAHLGFHRAFLPLYLFCLVGLVLAGHRLTARWLFAAHALATVAWVIHLGVKELRLG